MDRLLAETRSKRRTVNLSRSSRKLTILNDNEEGINIQSSEMRDMKQQTMRYIYTGVTHIILHVINIHSEICCSTLHPF